MTEPEPHFAPTKKKSKGDFRGEEMSIKYNPTSAYLWIATNKIRDAQMS